MCINPSEVWVQRGPGWRKEPVACRQCWRCQKNRLNDYVGRALCEAATSQVVCTLTLTYAPRSDLTDKILYPRHFQLFLKLLRNAGHKVRYLVAGEYGDLKGRAHFHCILFFSHLAESGKPAPAYNWGHLHDPASSQPFSRQIPQMQLCHISEWPHGHIQADWSADERSIRYVCKYILKDRANGWFSLSKKPPLGFEWFMRKAESARALGVLPRTFEYLPPGGDPKRPYLLTGAMRRDYLAAITLDPDDMAKASEWVRKTFEKHKRRRDQAEADAAPMNEQIAAFYRNSERKQELYALSQKYRSKRYNAKIDAAFEFFGRGFSQEEFKLWRLAHVVLRMKDKLLNHPPGLPVCIKFLDRLERRIEAAFSMSQKLNASWVEPLLMSRPTGSRKS